MSFLEYLKEVESNEIQANLKKILSQAQDFVKSENQDEEVRKQILQSLTDILGRAYKRRGNFGDYHRAEAEKKAGGPESILALYNQGIRLLSNIATEEERDAPGILRHMRELEGQEEQETLAKKTPDKLEDDPIQRWSDNSQKRTTGYSPWS